MPDLLPTIGVLISGASLALLYRYTRDTTAIQEATRQQAASQLHQARLSVMPLLTLDLRPAPPNRQDPSRTVPLYDFHLCNVGKGAAAEIVINPVHVRWYDYGLDERFEGELHFKRVPFLRPDSEECLVYTSEWRRCGTRIISARDLMDALQHQSGGGEAYELTLSFRDIEGARYSQVIRTVHFECTPGIVSVSELDQPS